MNGLLLNFRPDYDFYCYIIKYTFKSMNITPRNVRNITHKVFFFLKKNIRTRGEKGIQATTSALLDMVPTG
jgi:hypothetical protein